MPENISANKLRELACCQPDEAVVWLGSDRFGIASEEAEARLALHGANEVTHERPEAWYVQLFYAFINPFNGVLLAVALVSLFSDVVFASTESRSLKTIAVLTAMVLLSTLLRFWQEFRSQKAAEELKQMVRSTAAVLRADFARAEEMLISQIVPGDIISLAAGDMIPADLRIISAKDLFISQAILTGESIPVEKHAQLPSEAAADNSGNILEMETLCFMGTNVVSGTASAVVIATGDATYFGAMARRIVGERTLTSFDQGINRVSWLLIRFILVMTPLVFMINGLLKGDWLGSLLFAVSVAVGLTPEMLPMIVTANLAKGAVMMARRKTIVKRLSSIQNFGAMDILCTDKTGTLTQNKVILERHLDIEGNEDSRVLEYAWLNSFHQTGLRNLLDVAVLEYAGEHGVIDSLKHYQKIDEIPFDFARRRMSVVVQGEEGGKHLMICKGAVEEVLALCNKIEKSDENFVQDIAQDIAPHRERAKKFARHLNEEGLRVLGVAYRWLDVATATAHSYSVADEKEMVLAGFIAFLDPPKETAREAIAALREHGVGIKIITGDNEIVTRKICKEVGLEVEAAIVGKKVEQLSDDELAKASEHITIFAKMSPLQKSRVIRALQSKGHVVGYLGDGINDAAALKDADVGISVDTAVDIAKEAADIILLEKSLMVLEQGVIEGRKTFANIIKYIKMTCSSNFGNVLSVLIASIFLPFLPMLPIQLLIQSLLYNISQIAIPWDNVDAQYLRKPRKWQDLRITRFMFHLGPVSTLFDLLAFTILWYVFSANTLAEQSLFQSSWFVVGLLTQSLIVHMIRTPLIPFFESRASLLVIMLTIAVIMVGIYLPFSSMSENLGMTALPDNFFIFLVLLMLGYALLMQLIKKHYIKYFGEWL